MCKLASYAIKNQRLPFSGADKTHSFFRLLRKVPLQSDKPWRFPFLLWRRARYQNRIYRKSRLLFCRSRKEKRHHAYQLCSRQRMAAKQIVQVEWHKKFKWLCFSYFRKTPLPIQNLALAKIPVKDGKKKVCISQTGYPERNTYCFLWFFENRIPDSDCTLCANTKKNIHRKLSFYINNKLFQKTEVFPSESIEKSCFSDTIEQVLNQGWDIFCLS